MQTTVIKAIQKRIRKRAKGLGISPQDSRLLAHLIGKQCRSRGLEGGVDRMKRLKDAYFHAVYSTPDYPGWVARSSQGVPRALAFLRKYDELTQMRALHAYSAVTLDYISDRQVEKRISPIVNPPTSTGVDMVCQILDLGISHLSRSTPFNIKGAYRRVINSSNVENVEELIAGLQGHPEFDELFSLKEHNEVWYPINYISLFGKNLEPYRFIGSVEGTQEPGCKLRVYANPHPIFNSYLYPLHVGLARIRDGLASDCTRDQVRGAIWAHKKIREQSLFSLDLAAATCRVPLEPQIYMLQTIGVPDHLVRAFVYAATGDWESKLDHKQVPSILSWKVGQPLGLVPSMSCFSLFHNLVVMGLCTRLGLPVTDSFRILGDDIVIAYEDLADSYTEVFTDMGVEISHTKCRRGRLAEFAGYQITRSGYSRSSKWRAPTMANAISMSLEYARPLPLEYPKGVTKCQKVMLFSKGEYDPPAEEWRHYVKASSLLCKALTGNIEALPWPLWQVPTIHAWVKGHYKWLMVQPKNKDWDSTVEPVLSLVKGHKDETFITTLWKGSNMIGDANCENALHLALTAAERLWWEGCTPIESIAEMLDLVFNDVLSRIKLGSSRIKSRSHVNAMFVRGLLDSLLQIS